jgi:DNA-binding transcriptional LysR family regulator
MEHLSDLVVFARVAGRKSFTAAGRELRMSTSAVSKHIARLETELAAKLINRSAQQIILTESGVLFYEHCVRLLAAIEAARADVAGVSGEIAGVLRVHSTVGVGMNLVAPGVVDFAESHTSVTVQLTIGELPWDLTNRPLDVIVASRHFGEDDPRVYSELSCRDLGAMPYVLCASPSYFARRGAPETPHELLHHDCLIHATQKQNPDRWSFQQQDGSVKTVQVRETFRSNMESAILLAAVQGLGIARLPEYIARSDVSAGRLHSIFDGSVYSRRMVKAFYPRTRVVPPKTKVFLDLIQKRFTAS